MFRKKDTAPTAEAIPTTRVARKPATSSAPATPSAAAEVVQGSKGKQAYEARRAQKAGMGLEKWMAEKERRVQAERDTLQRARKKAAPDKKPGLLRRLLDRAHRPI